MNLALPKKIEYVLSALNTAGYEAYIVGGCVRDMLLGKSPQDFDITTSATPDIVQKIFKKTIPTGIKHGTVTVIVDKTPIEVTTFRTEGDYTDNRRPDRVEFVTDIKYDLSRRDFTVNAMAYNPHAGIVDVFGGKEDLKNGILKAVGDPKTRFLEDALRILRLFRFSSVLGFSIEENTLNAALETADLVQHVSCERILKELEKAVCGTNTSTLNMLLKTTALSFLGIFQSKDLSVLKSLPEKTKLRLFSFLRLCDCDTAAVLTRLKASNAQKIYCKKLSELTTAPLPKSKADIKLLLRKSGIEEFSDFLDFTEKVNKTDVLTIRNQLNEIIDNNEPYLIEHLSISGNDLKELGFIGEQIRVLLDKSLAYVIQNPDKNKKEILIEYLM